MGPSSYIYCSVAADRQATKLGQTRKNVCIEDCSLPYSERQTLGAQPLKREDARDQAEWLWRQRSIRCQRIL